MAYLDNRNRVAHNWQSGHSAQAGNLTTRNGEVYSYNHRIGHIAQDGATVALCCHYSPTTASHSSAIRSAADRVEECPEHGRDHSRGR